jgi:hypothetical protein
LFGVIVYEGSTVTSATAEVPDELDPIIKAYRENHG